MTPKKRHRKPRKRPQEAAPARNDPNAASRAQLGPDAERRAHRPPPDDASVEDPLQDWPDEGR